MKHLIIFLKKRRGMLWLTLLLLTGQVVGTLLIPRLIAEIVDTGILQGNMSAIYRVGMQMFVVSIVTALISILGCYYSSELSLAFGRDMREAIFKKSQAISLEQFERLGVSSMMTRSTSDISSLQQTIIMVLQMVVPAPLIIGVCIGMTVQINPSLSIIPVVCILIFIVLAGIILKKSQSLSRLIQVKMDRINQVVRESVTGIRVIRAFGNGMYEKKRSDKAFGEYADHMIRLNRLFAALNPAVWLVMGLSMAAIVGAGGMMATGGSMRIGQITAVTEYTIITLSYVIMAIMSSVTIPKMRACLQRLEEVLDMEPAITDVRTEVDKRSELDKKNGTAKESPVVEFSHVTFSYPGAEEPVLKDISFSCKAGETTAIIGSTGSGKSTIANLLLRLHEINEGEIFLKGENIKAMPQNTLRTQIAYAPQKAILFAGTIADNLRMGRKTAGEGDMMRALDISQAAAFVQSLPLGINAPVAQNGSNFSGGQKQRLAIARAIIRKAPVLVFDDSFSALDFKTDANLRKALKEHTADTAKLIIAQRIQTIADADQIIVLDEGKIAGIGSHGQLLGTCEIYRSIVQSQLSPEEVLVS